MGKTIDLTAADGHMLNAWLAEPAERPRGGVVVVQEIFGVNSHIRAVADGYAAEGYLAVAPSMFDRVRRGYESGYTPPEIEAGIALRQQIGWDDTVRDVSAAVEAIAHGGKVGVVGYCWGAAVAWLAASRVPGLAAAVAYYGAAIPSLVHEKPRCPMLLHFGEHDASLPADKARAVVQAHPRATAHFYAAGHGFNCDQRASYDEAAAELARERTLAFLAKHVG